MQKPSPLKPDATSGALTTSWLTTAERPSFPKLTENTSADVVIVGAGLAGLTTAYLLSKEGKKVVVLDDGEIASGETGRTTAHLSNALDDRYSELEKLFGKDGARLAAESHGGAIDTIERITKDEKIKCDFARLDGYLFLPKDGKEKELREELEAAHRAGLTGVEYLDEAGVQGFQSGPCLRFPNQGQFHILQYVNGLAQAITKRGGRIFTHTRVMSVHGGDDAHVKTKDGQEVRGQHILVATNSPMNDRVVMHTKQHPYRTYVVTARVPKGAVSKALYWDTADPYHYVRLQDMPGEDYELLIVGGEDHKTGQNDDYEHPFHCLEEWTRERFPAAKKFDVRWSGQVMEPVDALGYAGRNPLDNDNVYIITGDSGHGMTHSTLGATIVTDLIQGRENPWTKLYDPGRVTLSTTVLKEYVKENVNVAAEYTDLVTGGEVKTEADIKPGTGAVMGRGPLKVAVYRDDKGQTHECSAICPHLHCVVHWNNAEKSWDCPCHGSRFDPYGVVVNGPAASDLPKVE